MEYLLFDLTLEKKTDFSTSVSIGNMSNLLTFKSNISEFTSPKIKLY